MEVHELAKQIESFQKEMREDMAVIKRGVYGDPANKVKGLLERQNDDDLWRSNIDARMEKTERKQWKLGVIVGIVLIGLDAAWNFFKDKV